MAGQWERLVATWTNDTGGNVDIRVNIYNKAGDNSTNVWYDGVQLEEEQFPTSYVDGSLSWGSWSGTAHDSASTRTATEVNLDDHATLLDSEDTWTLSLWWQPEYDADGYWPDNAILFYALGAGAYDKVYVEFEDSDNTFKVYIKTETKLTSSAQTFSAGDWIHVVVTIDFSSNEHNLYIDGVLEDTDTTSLAAPSFDEINLGSDNSAGQQANAAYAELALLDVVLTAEQVAGLYQRGAPLADAGALDSPGLYILDGRFRIASSLDTTRIEITPDEIVGYNAGTKQFYLQASDGKAYAGGGNVWMDEDGYGLANFDSYDDAAKLYAIDGAKWVHVYIDAASERLRLMTSEYGSGEWTEIGVGDIVHYDGGVPGELTIQASPIVLTAATWIGLNGNVSVGTSSSMGGVLGIDMSTEDLEFHDAGSDAATEQDWIEVEVGGNTGYIRVYAAK